MATELKSPPTDAISGVKYSPVPGEDLLIASSWDSKLRLYDVSANELKAVQQSTAPILDCCFMGDSKSAVYGGLSRELRMRQFDKGMDTLIGTHAAPIRCVEYHNNLNLIFSGGWDGYVKTWDARASSGTSVGAVSVGGKVFGTAVGGNKLVVADSAKVVSIFDVRNLSQPEERRENVLRYQLRAIRCFPDSQGFVVSSIEGRCAWEYFNTSSTGPRNVSGAIPQAQKKYAFKCHRDKVGDVETVFPVNALAFHPFHGTFASGGGDGGVSVWDGYNKRRLWRLSFNTSIASLAFSSNGSQLAVGVSYDFSSGPKDPSSIPLNQITIRQVKEEDTRPKPVGTTSKAS